MELNEKLKMHIESLNKNILAKKENKFRRDKQVFHKGRAYKWHQQTKNRTHQRHQAQYGYQSGSSDTSSMASNVSQSFPKETKRIRKPKRHRDGDSFEGRPKRSQGNRTRKTPSKTPTSTPQTSDNVGVPTHPGSNVKETASLTNVRIPSLFQPKNVGLTPAPPM